MRLAVFTGQYFWFDGKHYSTDEAFVKFVTSFYPHFEKIIFCDAVRKERKKEAYILDPAKAEVCPLPYFSVYSLWKNILITYPKIYRIIRDKIHTWDIVWLPATHPVAFLFVYVCHRKRKPFFQIVRAKLMELVRHSNKGARRYRAVAVVAVLEYVSQRLSRKYLTLTVGREIYNTYKRKGGRVHEIAVSLVSERDIEETLRTKRLQLHKPVRLLSVGRLDAEKGLYFLIKAVDELIKEKRLDVVLQMVGKGYKGEEERRLRQEVKKRRLARHIRFLGYAPHGPRLFRLYRESDIFVLPSLSEGCPQTLFEAMACGVPVVATRVGGIRYLIEDGENGLLINSASPTEMASAVERLVMEDDLRDRLVKNGFATARNHTLEVERERIWGCIQGFLRSARSGENSVLL